ncbi:MAG: N-acetylmuramoyl-L-alanine amidase [Dehalococcoidales bacterium]|nr:N-acetylmuramoyl-L-alanine amidase [Dehalococcoidales bacterium]
MAVIRQGNPNRICVHHSAVAPGADNLNDLRRRLASYETTHSKKSWAETTKTGGEHGYSYLAYHIAVAKDGHEIRSQDDKYVLYHAGDNARGKDSFNLHGIGVLLDGNYETELPTDHQKEALARIIARFERKYGVDVLVRGHKQTSLSGTACPGKNIGDNTAGLMKEAIARANEILKNNETDEPLNAPTTPPVSEVDTLREQIDRLNQELGTLRGEKDALAKLLEEKEATIGQLKADVKKWQAEAKSANDNLGKVLEEKGAVEKDLESAQRKIDRLEKELAEMEKEKNANWQLYKKALESQADKLTTGELVKILLARLFNRMNNY